MAIPKLQEYLQRHYHRELFAKDVLKNVFGKYFEYFSNLQKIKPEPTASEKKIISNVGIYGKIVFAEGQEITCFEIELQSKVRIEQSRVAITQYVKKLLIPGQGALINFISPSYSDIWRFTLLAKDTIVGEKGIEEKNLASKRFTYLLGPSETCKTAAQRLENGIYKWEELLDAFSVEKLSIHFFDEYKLHYKKFIAHIIESNFKLYFGNDEKNIRDFVKKLLGRIVFLYFVQKKRWLGASDTNYTDGDTNFLFNLFQSSGKDSRFYPFYLSKLFFETLNRNRKNDEFELPNKKKVKIPYLNGGLFDREENDKDVLYLKPELFSNEKFSDVILDKSTFKTKSHRGFFDFLNSYNFTVHEDSPNDHTVAVDPEMLSHIFENLLEDNKDKGAFYTPKEIVHYMCSQSLIEYLWTHLEKEKGLTKEEIEKFVQKKEITNLPEKHLARIDSLLDDVKICDPAIGSGAFPMGLLQEIFSLKELIAYQLGKELKPSIIKENIIQNSIYGVDIEKGAVDIARLRFWLSLVVDEEMPKPLPNLDYKIVVGDSLLSRFGGEIVEIDWETTTDLLIGSKEVEERKKLLEKITAKQKKYFHPEAEDKAKLAEEIRNLKINILINQLNYLLKTIDISKGKKKTKENLKLTFENNFQKDKWKNLIGYLTKLKNDPKLPFQHFNWNLDFPEILNPYLVKENAGFDIVIGNPPYVGRNTIFDDKEKEFIRAVFETSEGKYEVYQLFIEKSSKIAKSKKAIIVLITPQTWLSIIQATELRRYLYNNLKFYSFLFLGRNIFESAIVDTLVSILITGSLTEKIKYGELSKEKNIGIDILFEEFNIDNISKNNFIISFPQTGEHQNILNKIKSHSVFLGELGFWNDGVKIVGKAKEYAFQFKKVDNSFFPMVVGKDIEKYNLKWSGLFCCRNKDAIEKKGVTDLRLRDEKVFKNEKILVRKTGNQLIASIDKDKFYYEQSVFGFYLESKIINLGSILAILNSKLGGYLLRMNPFSKKDTFPQIRLHWLKEFPISKNLFNVEKKFEAFVNYILFFKLKEITKSENELIPIYFEQVIDGMVYELYFPELLKKQKREIIQHLGELPEITDEMNEAKKLEIIRSVFNRLNDKNHPVKTNLFYMDSIPEIRIIEGKDENH